MTDELRDEPLDLSTLPKRMWWAGDVLHEATVRRRREHPGALSMWTGAELRSYSTQWEAEDSAESERSQQVWALVEDLGKVDGGDLESITYKLRLQSIARGLLDCGWTKNTGTTP